MYYKSTQMVLGCASMFGLRNLMTFRFRFIEASTLTLSETAQDALETEGFYNKGAIKPSELHLLLMGIGGY